MKPFYSSKKNQIQASILSPERRVLYTIDGEWNGVMYIKSGKKVPEVFINTKTEEVSKKMVRPIAQQSETESRRFVRALLIFKTGSN